MALCVSQAASLRRGGCSAIYVSAPGGLVLDRPGGAPGLNESLTPAGAAIVDFLPRSGWSVRTRRIQLASQIKPMTEPASIEMLDLGPAQDDQRIRQPW